MHLSVDFLNGYQDFCFVLFCDVLCWSWNIFSFLLNWLEFSVLKFSFASRRQTGRSIIMPVCIYEDEALVKGWLEELV